MKQLSESLFDGVLERDLTGRPPQSYIRTWSTGPDPPDTLTFDCQKIDKNLTFFPKKLPKIFIFFKKIAIGNFFEKMKIFGNFFGKMSSFWQFFDSQMAIFRRVSSRH